MQPAPLLRSITTPWPAIPEPQFRTPVQNPSYPLGLHRVYHTRLTSAIFLLLLTRHAWPAFCNAVLVVLGLLHEAMHTILQITRTVLQTAHHILVILQKTFGKLLKSSKASQEQDALFGEWQAPHEVIFSRSHKETTMCNLEKKTSGSWQLPCERPGWTCLVSSGSK